MVDFKKGISNIKERYAEYQKEREEKKIAYAEKLEQKAKVEARIGKARRKIAAARSDRYAKYQRVASSLVGTGSKGGALRGQNPIGLPTPTNQLDGLFGMGTTKKTPRANTGYSIPKPRSQLVGLFGITDRPENTGMKTKGKRKTTVIKAGGKTITIRG